MLKTLKISNFRLFSKEVEVRFRPITIFIGENNAGKSSVIKFLMMLKQSASPLSPKGFLNTAGDEVKLGKFSELKNRKSKSRSLVFSLEVSENSTPGKEIYDYLDEETIQLKRVYATQATVIYNKKEQFLGRDQGIIFSAGNKNFLTEVSKISPNSAFLKREPKKVKNDRDFVLDVCINNLGQDIQGLQHLSATRRELNRGFDTSTTAITGYVGKEGENTLLELWGAEILNDQRKKEFLTRHTTEVLGIDNIALKKLGSLISFEGQNIQTTAKVNLSNFGFGVSQCMPIFVQGLIMPPNTQLITEQPEAQIHPSAQLELGSFFAELWKEYKVGSIIETHSDNLLMRFRRLIARGDLSKDEVSIAYFHNKAGVPKIKNLDINEDGSLEPGLPLQFFGGNLEEVLNIGVRK